MRPTAHRIVPIAAMVKVIVRDTHISDKIANSQRIVPHIKGAIIKPTELLLFRLALGVFFFSLIKPSLLFGCTETPLTMSFKVDIRSTINEYIPCGIYINAEYFIQPSDPASGLHLSLWPSPSSWVLRHKPCRFSLPLMCLACAYGKGASIYLSQNSLRYSRIFAFM